MLKQIQLLPQSLLFRFLPTFCREHNLSNNGSGSFHFTRQQRHLYLRSHFADIIKNLGVTLLGSEKVIKNRSKIGFCVWNVAH